VADYEWWQTGLEAIRILSDEFDLSAFRRFCFSNRKYLLAFCSTPPLARVLHFRVELGHHNEVLNAGMIDGVRRNVLYVIFSIDLPYRENIAVLSERINPGLISGFGFYGFEIESFLFSYCVFLLRFDVEFAPHVNCSIGNAASREVWHLLL